MKKSIKRTMSSFISTFFVVSQLIFPVLAATPVRAAGTIGYDTHEGQEKTAGVLGGYTTGDVKQYSEGEYVNFRFNIDTNDTSSGQLQVEFDEDDGKCLFWNGIFNLGTHDGSAAAVSDVSGATPTVTTSGGVTGAGTGTWIQQLDISFPGAGSATVNYYLQLSDEAGACTGSSQQNQLSPGAVPGDVTQGGAKSVPIPAKDVLVLPDITVYKVVDDNGDDITDRPATAGEWDFKLDDGALVPTDSAGIVVFENVAGGDHSIAELNGPDGYVFYGDGGDCNGEVVNGVWNFTITPTTDTADLQCFFWNQSVPENPTITLAKEVVGGDATPDLFTLLVNEDSYGHGDVIEAEAGEEYYLGEGEFTDYTLTSIECTENGVVGAGPLPSDPLVLEEGQHVTCTWTNTYVPPTGTITVTKVVNNNHQGTAVPGDFTLLVDSTVVSSGVPTEFPATVEYTVSEEEEVGYQQTGLVCYDSQDDQDIPVNLGATFTLERNQHVECTITNEDIPYPELTVLKRVINNDGRNGTLGDFTLYFNGDDIGDPDTAIGATNPSGDSEYVGTWNIGPIMPGSPVNVTEDDPGPNYQLTSTMCFLGDNPNDQIAHPIAEADYGQRITCVLTNNDTPIRSGSITVTKRVQNDDGGTLRPADFPLFVNNTRVMTGESNQFQPGDYTISEVQQEGYRLYNAYCYDADSFQRLGLSFSLLEDQNVRCIFFNTDLPANVTVYKRVINNDGGQAGVGDFDLFINDREVNHGQTYFIDANRWLTISEQPAMGYRQVELVCRDLTGDQNVNPLRFRTENGHNYRCVIVNDDIPPKVVLTKTVINDNGGDLDPEDFTLLLNDRPVPQDQQIRVRAGMELTPSEYEQKGYELDKLKCYLVRPVVDGPTDRLVPNGNGDNDYQYLDIPFTLRPGQVAHCEFVNDDIGPVVVVEKRTIPPYSDQEWRFRVANNREVVERFTLDTLPWDEEHPSEYEVNDLSAGWVRIDERPARGWMNGALVTCTNGYNGDDGPWLNGLAPFLVERNTTNVKFRVELGDVIFCTFLNVEKGDVKVTKFYDVNENGYFDEGETALPGWEMTLDAYRMRMCEDRDLTRITDETCETDTVVGLNGHHYDREPDRSWTQVTEDNGMTTFEGLWPSPMAFYHLSETEQDGWHQTNIYCRYDIVFPGPNGVTDGPLPAPRPMPYPGPMGGHVMVLPGITTECFVGNTYDPVLTIEKFNDQPEPTVTGETVQYTIVVTVPEESGCVYRQGLHYFPVVAEQFENDFPVFRMNCETEEEEPSDFAQAVIFDDCLEECKPLGMEVTVTDLPPEGFEYVSGSWTAVSNVRGDLKAAGITGEPGYASPGQWTLTSPISPFLVPGEVVTLTYNTVIDDAVTNGVYPDTAFVEGFTSSGERIFGNLHFTNTPFVGTQVEVLSVDTVTGGFVLGVLSETGNPAILAPIAGVLVSAGAVMTGSRRKERRWLKRLGASIGGAFAALALTAVFATSVMAAGFWTTNISLPNPFTRIDTINIDYQVSSTEAADTFEVTLYQNGVNVGNETVTTPYGDSGRFAVTLPGEGDYTFKTEVENLTQGGSQMSDEVSVQFDATSPGAPAFGTTERSGNDYTVNFTAPSGDVNSVKIYASTQKSFDLDDSNLVGEVTVSPGQEVSFDYTAPDSEQRYFAVVAVDDAGNQSGAVGDAEVQLVPGDTDPATLDSDGDGVPDVDDPAPFDPEITGEEADDDEGQTAGATDDGDEEDAAEDGSNTAAWILVAVVVLGAIAYYFYKNRAEDEAL